MPGRPVQITNYTNSEQFSTCSEHQGGKLFRGIGLRAREHPLDPSGGKRLRDRQSWPWFPNFTIAAHDSTETTKQSDAGYFNVRRVSHVTSPVLVQNTEPRFHSLVQRRMSDRQFRAECARTLASRVHCGFSHELQDHADLKNNFLLFVLEEQIETRTLPFPRPQAGGRITMTTPNVGVTHCVLSLASTQRVQDLWLPDVKAVMCVRLSSVRPQVM